MKKEEYERWYRSCDFIRKELQFYSFEDFLDQAVYTRKLYLQCKPLIRQLYQWYVYASPLLYKQKQGIWEFLNMRLPLKVLKKLK